MVISSYKNKTQRVTNHHDHYVRSLGPPSLVASIKFRSRVKHGDLKKTY